MPSHQHLHRRNVARGFDPLSMADAAASAFRDTFGNHKKESTTTSAPATSPQMKTVTSIVYHTASPTFDGPIGGYSTQTKHETTAPEVHHTTSSPVETHAPTTSKPADAATTKHATSSSKSTGLPSSIVPPSSTLGLGGPLVVASSTTPLLIDTASPTASRSEATSNSATPAASSGGMSAGGKAGLAIGIICIVGVVIGLVFFFVKKRKDAQNAERLDDEKAATAFAAAGAPRSQTTTQPTPAPARLSLRPVTQFGQFFSGAAAGAATGAAAGAAAAPKSQAPANFPNSQISPQDSKENPFGNHAETIDATNAKGPAIVQAVGPGGEVLAGAAAAGAVVGLARAQSKRENAKPMDLTKKDPFRGPPSPAMTDYSVSEVASNAPQAQDKTGAAIAAAGGPANSAVHRVQLDFKPSLEDELELQAGQLIRLLHEYDDGWVSDINVTFCFVLTATFRPSAFALTAPNKVLSLELVCLSALSSRALHKTALVDHLNQVCEAQVPKLARRLQV